MSPAKTATTETKNAGLSLQEKKQMVYLISDGKHIKIGKAYDVNKRLGQLQTGNPKPLSIVAVLHGYTHEEGLLHTRLHGRRVRGEWFRLRPWHVAWILATHKIHSAHGVGVAVRILSRLPMLSHF